METNSFILKQSAMESLSRVHTMLPSRDPLGYQGHRACHGSPGPPPTAACASPAHTANCSRTRRPRTTAATTDLSASVDGDDVSEISDVAADAAPPGSARPTTSALHRWMLRSAPPPTSPNEACDADNTRTVCCKRLPPHVAQHLPSATDGLARRLWYRRLQVPGSEGTRVWSPRSRPQEHGGHTEATATSTYFVVGGVEQLGFEFGGDWGFF